MIFICQILIINLICILQSRAEITYFVTPTYTGCNSSCLGTSDQPFDSIGILMNKILLDTNSKNTDYKIVLLPDTTPNNNPHYLFFAEYIPSTNTAYYNFTKSITIAKIQFFVPTIINVRSLSIKPLLCEDYPLIANCLNNNQLMTIYLKTEAFSIIATSLINVTNIIFDGSENIYYYSANQTAVPTNNVNLCLYTRKLCCQNPGSNGLSNISSDIICYYQHSKLNNVALFTQGLFITAYAGSSSTTIPTIYVNNSEFYKITLFQTTSFFVYDTTVANVSFSYSLLNYSFFYQGFIAENYSNITTCNPNLSCIKTIAILNSSFININPYNLTNAALTVTTSVQTLKFGSEGYILFSNISSINSYNNNSFFGLEPFKNPPINPTNLTMISCNISNALSATFKFCPNGQDMRRWFQYQSQITDVFMAGDSKTEISNNLQANNIENFTDSSAIYFQNYSGNVTIQNCIFENLTGNGGSAFVFKNLADFVNFTITNNTFRYNYGYFFNSAFSIRRRQYIYYEAHACPNIIFDNNIVLGNWGCYFSMYNIMMTCSIIWSNFFTAEISNAKGATSLTIDFNYIVSNAVTKFTKKANDIMANNFTPQVIIRNSLFQENLLALSNGIIIQGFVSTLVQNNTFKNNGVMVENYGIILVRNTSNQNPLNAEYLISNFLTPYCQSSPLFVSRNLFSKIINNTFNNNWATYTGDTLVGSQISLIDNLIVSNWTQLIDNVFINNVGIPSEIKAVLNNTGLQNYPITMPLITISYYTLQQFSYNWANSLGLLDDVTIVIQNCNFINNSFTFNYALHDYQRVSLFSNYMRDSADIRNYNSFIRLITYDEFASRPSVIKEVSYKIKMNITNGIISNNTFLTSGCLFTPFWLTIINIQNLTFTNNQGYQQNITPQTNSTEAVKPSTSYFDQNLYYGLLCGSKRVSGVSLALPQVNIINNSFINNQGILVNLYQGQLINFVIINTTFINNTCLDGPLLLIQGTNTLVINNTFYEYNNGHFGIVMIRSNSIYNGWNNTYFNNRGYHASTLFFDMATNINQEIYANFTLNNINSIYLTYADLSTPISSNIYFNLASNTFIINSTFSNTNTYSGIFISSGSKITFNNCQFFNNTGFGNIAIGYIQLSSDITLINSSISKFDFGLVNKGISSIDYLNKQLFYISSSSLLLNQSIIRNINAANGSYLFQMSGGILNILFSQLLYSQGFNVNGYIFQATYSSQIFVNYSYFLNNGQLALLSYSNITFSESNITNIGSGSIDNSNNGNSASNVGSYSRTFISTDNSAINFLSSNFSDNGILVQILKFIDSIRTQITIISSNIYNLYSNQGHCISSSYSNIIISQTNFINNTFIKKGSIINAMYPNSLNISDSYFDNSTQLNGQLYAIGTNQSYFNLTRNQLKGSIDRSSITIIGGYMLIFDSMIVKAVNFMNFSSGPSTDSILQFGGINMLWYVNNTICDFSNNKLGVVSIEFTTANSTGIIENSNFLNNISPNGGGIQISSITDTTIIFTGNNFINNKAMNTSLINGLGGAIYLDCAIGSICNTTINNSLFKNNYAISGGAIYWLYYPPFIDLATVTFANNTAYYYGPDLASLPISFDVWNDNYTEVINYDWQANLNSRFLGQEILTIDNIISGANTENIGLALLDVYGQITKNDNASYLIFLQAVMENYLFYTSPSQIICQSGIYNLNGTDIQLYPGKAISTNVYSSVIAPFPIIGNQQNSVQISNFQIQINFRNCVIGEIIQQDICLKCEYGYYSLDLETNSPGPCQICNWEQFYCYGGADVAPNYGFWKMNSTADLIFSCPNPDACNGTEKIGKVLNFSTQCASGYSGNLCFKCQPGWAKYGSDSVCIQCNNDSYYYIKLFLLMVTQSLLIYLSAKSTLRIVKDGKIDENESYTTALMKILMNFGQAMSVVSNFPVRLPAYLTETLTTGDKIVPTLADLFSIDCFVELAANKIAMTNYFLRMIAIFCIPLFVSLIWIVFVSLKRYFKKETYVTVITYIVVLLVYFQPNIIKMALSLFQCVNLYRSDQPIQYLAKNYDVKCWEGEHLSWVFYLALPNLILYGVIFSLIFYLILYTKRKHLHEEDIMRKYAFLFMVYRQNYYYWEFVMIWRNMLLISCLVFIAPISVNLQFITCLLVILIYLLLQIFCRPFIKDDANNLEIIMNTGILFIIITGMYFLNIVDEVGAIDILILIFCTFSLALPLLLWIRQYIKVLWGKFKESKEMLLSKLESFKDCLRKCKILKPKKPSNEYVIPSENPYLSPPVSPELQHNQDQPSSVQNYLKGNVSKKSKFSNDINKIIKKVDLEVEEGEDETKPRQQYDIFSIVPESKDNKKEEEILITPNYSFNNSEINIPKEFDDDDLSDIERKFHRALTKKKLKLYSDNNN